MKCFRTFYSAIAVFSVILLHFSCDRKKELSTHQLIRDTHFKVEFSDIGYTLEPSIPIGVYIANNRSSVLSSSLKYEDKGEFYSIVDSNKISNSKLENKDINIYAYLPYQNTTNSDFEKHHIIVETDQRSLVNYQASDFKYAVTELKTLGTEIDLQFKEKLAEIVINVKSKGYRDPNDDMNIEIVDVATSANINLKTGILSDLGDIGSVKLMRRSLSNPDFDYTMQGIFIPQEIPADRTILKIEIGGKFYSHQTKYDIIIEPAMQYIYNVTIDNRGISVESEAVHRIREGAQDNLNTISAQKYNVGDYYPMANDKQSAIGVVFTTFDNGLHGKVLSLDEALDVNWGPLIETGAKSKISGASNKSIIERQNTNLSEYRALSWCLKKGKGWYLPAINELVTIYQQKDILNHSLSPLLRSNNLGDGVYLSSTENDESNVLVLYFGNGQRFQQDKNLESNVRAIYDF